ncbi:MAG: TrmH family RNA methyltransferase [Gemmatimonadota bacterium]
MLSRSEEKRIRGLARRKNREAEGLFLAEGVRVVEELLGAGVVPRLAVVSSSLEDTERGVRLAARLPAAVEVRHVSASELKALSDTSTPQGVLVVAETPGASLAALAPAGPSVVLVLDGVQDPGNLGTLGRAAAAFGCDGLVYLPGTVDPWSPKAVRASAGAVFRIPVVAATVEGLDGWRARHGYVLAGADAGGEPVGPLGERVALVVGNEGAGLTGAVAARCDRFVSVPMRGGTESLNVAVAGGILLYELTRGQG